LGFGVGVFGSGVLAQTPNPQSPIPNPQSPMINKGFYLNKIYKYINKFFVFLFDNKIKYNNILPLF
jgi:hypothetical protein